ncbi:SMC-Scp complex subunit ScpB [Patescibacteria group bacterium]|nr:SMC-Scp complex subunit ScpB [Patescibacteria group bacterium]MBU1246642.1 SMC-Scp complex subunit ScpB [Patescibacteria group bacterium]MBU1519674.1 SMC-Scp complex subunit ScpB [Patescibacteria group bacterium]MBU1730545.1 SMC-Scp complex subunit ScpB [Patescibacteria group bacterium]MBU1956132.1 SMC-Scp complex subunit ScpB [Patescibacteria group bacterium]
MEKKEKDLEKYIEAILFHKAEAVKISFLVDILDATKEVVLEAIAKLKIQLEGRGVVLMQNNDMIMLGTTPQTAVVVEKIIKDELDKDLGKPGLETLSIVLYRKSVKRSEIDYIRGVNSSYILRNMVMRGLVERINMPHNKSFFYRPTFELLAYLGVSCVEELPNYDLVNKQIGQVVVDKEMVTLPN